MRRVFSNILGWVLWALTFSTMAAVPTWQIIPSESSLSFTATQNNAPVSGEFKQFSGEIHFDPNQLNASHVKITVDIASVSDAYNEISQTLKDTDWFDEQQFPKAVFESKSFAKTGNKTYQAKGMLTIRDKTVPITLSFMEEENTPEKTRIKGSTVLKRTEFGVGQGEWSDIKTVGDEVKVNFILTAHKK